MLGKAECRWYVNSSALRCCRLVAVELRWGRMVGTAVAWLFLPERFLTCLDHLPRASYCVCYPLIRIRALPLPLAPVAAPHPLRICWEKQPKSPGIEKTHGKDLLEDSCSLWVVRGEIFPVPCTEMCWKPRARGPGLDAALCPRSTKPLLPPALRICIFPFPWPRG